jgi:hypothetical protein
MITLRVYLYFIHRLLHYDDRVLDLVAQWKRFQSDDTSNSEIIKFVYKVGNRNRFKFPMFYVC